MSARGRYYSQAYSRLDEDPSIWSTDITTSDAIPEPYDPTHSTATHAGAPDAMPLEPYPHYQADYRTSNPLNDYSAKLPSYPGSAKGSPRGSPSRDRPSRPTSYHDRGLSYDNSRPVSYQPEYPANTHFEDEDTSYRSEPRSQPRSERRHSEPRHKHTRTRSSAYHPEYEDFEALKHREKPRSAKPQRHYPWTDWSRKRKWIIFGSSAAILILIIIIIAVAIAVSNRSYPYTPSYDAVTNEEAFASGGATTTSVNNTADGIGAGQDKYTYYQGTEANFPPPTAWVSFENMWAANLPLLQTSCSALGEGPDNTDAMNDYIYEAIQSRANASLVDHRFILATILQESNGCVRVGHTTSSGGVRNPGLMQSHNGHAYDGSFPELSIMQMVQDGTQGTEHGDGLVQNLNMYGNVYKAARGYNSGYIPPSGDLSLAAGATACYVSDIANRLTGWTTVDSLCPGDE